MTMQLRCRVSFIQVVLSHSYYFTLPAPGNNTWQIDSQQFVCYL